MNYVTRQVRHWRKAGKVQKDIKLRFPESRLTRLESFDREATDRLPKAARGYIDEKFTLVQY